MNRLFLRVAAIAVTLIGVGVLAYLAHREQSQAQGDAIIAKYNHFKREGDKVALPWMLYCPPFGKQSVKFQTGDLKGEAPAEIPMQNTIAIIRRWPELWGSAYAEIDNSITDQNASRDDFSKHLTITVELPDTLLEEAGNWSVKVAYQGGSYSAQMVGAKAAQVIYSEPGKVDPTK